MDYSRIYDIIRKAFLAQGVSEEQYDRKETLYYDETDNVKHLVVKDDKQINATPNTCFVLGGVQAESAISDDDLHDALGKTRGKELKSKNDLRGAFVDILRKDKVTRVLNLVRDKGWHVHFLMVQIWYYAFVDIIDSVITTSPDLVNSFKATIYKILKSNPENTLRLMDKYNYPDIKDNERDGFISELISLTTHFAKSCPNYRDKILSLAIRQFLSDAKGKELTFIQDETPREWVASFKQFYLSEIYSYIHKTLIFDTEKQVEAELKKISIEVNGQVLNNYRFEESISNPMIQVCDYIVSVLRKYFVFLDREWVDINRDIECFDMVQLNNLVLLNKVLKCSFDYSPLFFHYIASVETMQNVNTLMNKYGKE